ncbi:sugar ABC transporter ATP-binding protein [Clostridium estertheticum]|uniref:sugar ABC transporter ATP-binding protein n=1 Tax=Clostridium estertheticum TaxID=238834 RepID=UPI001C6DF761|nr:sugar ABC transporter ATP-binding protein [Clostridium estertheticum]MBW9172678.1 sugar ABC transporter ATP-binding protein [Clostridium estertheticum]WLC73579.1 sugar ABC transporter ATP-binding protein [Clostridium estertheticum]
MALPFIELKGVSKIFPGVIAIDNMDIDVYPGEILGLVGENGAGKSTLIKLLTGAHRHDLGEILVEGKEANINGPKQAMSLGITAIYQELNIVKDLSVAENVFLGRELKNKGIPLLNIKEMATKSVELLNELGQKIDPKMIISKLGMGQQQMVEIAKALSVKTKLLIMDEPTSSLSSKEVKELLRTIKELKQKGIAVIFISHRLDEIMEVCDRVTIMRDGKKVKTLPIEDVTVEELIRLMVGRDLKNQFPKFESKIGEEALKIENYTRDNVFDNVSFTVHKGEILGLSGLVGAGRTEVARAIFGIDMKNKGTTYINGKKVNIRSPKEAMKQGIAFLTEDRKGQGLVLDNTVAFNMNIASLDKCKSGRLLDLKKLKERTVKNIKKLDINPPSDTFMVRKLSGGNQQKVVIAKWLNTHANIFIFDEPTRGIDVGAKVEVYNVMNELVMSGAAVIMISSELPEILGMSDHIIVMHEGKVTGEFDIHEANQENIMKAASGGV